MLMTAAMCFLYLHFPHFSLKAEEISQDALRMRLARLCERKPKTNKCHVDDATHEQWRKGGEQREWLEMALAEALDKIGSGEMHLHRKVRVSWPHVRSLLCTQVEFQSRVLLVRERMSLKEQEVTGQWLTREKMVKSGDYSTPLVVQTYVAHHGKHAMQGRPSTASWPTARSFPRPWSGLLPLNKFVNL